MSKSMNKANIESESIIEINQLQLENVTLIKRGVDPILDRVDIQLPVDQTVIVESSNPYHALTFLEMIAGYVRCETGRILWSGQDIFSDEMEFDPRPTIGACFEGKNHAPAVSLLTFMKTFAEPQELETIIEMFELTPYMGQLFSGLEYGFQKLIYLIRALAKQSQLILLEDPAQGLTEQNWLNFLDYLQLKQREGYARHVFVTNSHSTAFNNLEHNKIFIEDGVIFFDESAPVKKIAHF